MFDGLPSITKRQLEHPCIRALQVSVHLFPAALGRSIHLAGQIDSRLCCSRVDALQVQSLRYPIGKGRSIVHSTETETVHKISRLLKNGRRKG